jgi:hypothetical protein
MWRTFCKLCLSSCNAYRVTKYNHEVESPSIGRTAIAKQQNVETLVKAFNTLVSIGTNDKDAFSWAPLGTLFAANKLPGTVITLTQMTGAQVLDGRLLIIISSRFDADLPAENKWLMIRCRSPLLDEGNYGAHPWGPGLAVHADWLYCGGVLRTSSATRPTDT